MILILLYSSCCDHFSLFHNFHFGRSVRDYFRDVQGLFKMILKRFEIIILPKRFINKLQSDVNLYGFMAFGAGSLS